MTAYLTELVLNANPDRDAATLLRRAMKVLEEAGEISEAWLNITSAQNGKGKTWNDVREEIADVLIVSLDIALTLLPGETTTQRDLTERVASLVDPLLDNVFRQTPDQFILAMTAVVEGLSRVLKNLVVNRAFRDDLRSAAMRLVTAAATLAVVPMPDEAETPHTVRYAALTAEVERKLSKWTRMRETSTDAVSQVMA